MPVVLCVSCGNTTNSAVSDYWAARSLDPLQPGVERVATECYAAWVDGKWVKGCAFDKAEPYVKKFVLELIGRTAT